MSYDIQQFRQVVLNILTSMGAKYAAPAAVNLVLGTAAQESRLGTYLYQMGNGPAKGICQMEPATEKDIWDNFINQPKNADHKAAMYMACGRMGPGPWLEYDLGYQIAMCRMHYYRVAAPLPNDNLAQLAAFYKRFYNTPAGAATEQQFIDNYKKYVGV